MQVLGKGQFGIVCLGVATIKGNSVNVAVKSLSASNVPEHELKQFEYEARLLTAIEHPNIVRVLAVCFQSQPNQIVLELMAGGDLKTFLRNLEKTGADIDADELLGVCVQV